ncbi:MAG: hypothetical protein WC254_02170 [Candidatus Woesearchaeota archaeon]|jgi:hypothetical protein
MNKKGVATALVDFYVTVLIIMVIIIFFFALHFKTEKSIINVTGEEIGLDATQIALLYAQTPIETSIGRMTFGEFLAKVADDETLQEEFTTKTEEFFTIELMEKLQTLISVTITVSCDGDSKEIFSYDARTIFTKFSQSYTGPGMLLLQLTSGDNTIFGSGQIIIPLQTPGEVALITVQTYSQ